MRGAATARRILAVMEQTLQVLCRQSRMLRSDSRPSDCAHHAAPGRLALSAGVVQGVLQVPADLRAIIAWGEATYRVKDLRFRCTKCGSRRTGSVVMARAAMAVQPWKADDDADTGTGAAGGISPAGDRRIR